MKKIASLSVVVLLGLGAFAQDTIPKNNLNRIDTIPDYNKTDTGSTVWKNRAKQDSNYANKKPGYLDSLQERTLSKNDTANRRNWNSQLNHSEMQDSNRTNQTDSVAIPARQDSSAATATTTKPADTAKITDRLLMYNDSMYLVKDGDSSLLQKTYTLESGTMVMSDGNVKFPSGKTVTLKNGQFIEITPVVYADKKTTAAPKLKVKKTYVKKTAKPKDK